VKEVEIVHIYAFYNVSAPDHYGAQRARFSVPAVPIVETINGQSILSILKNPVSVICDSLTGEVFCVSNLDQFITIFMLLSFAVNNLNFIHIYLFPVSALPIYNI